jgi:uncharacterized membrane protein YeiH
MFQEQEGPLLAAPMLEVSSDLLNGAWRVLASIDRHSVPIAFKDHAGTILVLDLAGTFVFALSGAAAAIKERLDLFGVLVLSFAAATSGGITRDLLIGAVPPQAISDWRYLGVSLLAGVVTFFWHPVSGRLRNHVLVFDGAGLALFAVVGAQKALAYGLNPPMAALLGMLTGIGGGIVRDVLLSEIPTVLRAELYAVASLAGATVVVTAHVLHGPPTTAAITGALLCFGLRLIGMWRGWRLPTSRAWRGTEPPSGKSDSDPER